MRTSTSTTKSTMRSLQGLTKCQAVVRHSSASSAACHRRTVSTSAIASAPSLSTPSGSISMPPPPLPRAAIVRSPKTVVRSSRRSQPAGKAKAAASATAQDSHFLAEQILRTAWLDPKDLRKRELRDKLQERQEGKGPGLMPKWLNAEYELASSFRAARARLWLPSNEDINSASLAEGLIRPLEDSSSELWLESTLNDLRSTLGPAGVEAWDLTPIEERQDLALRNLWRAMSKTQREHASVRARYECARRLGWRKGYSAGFPVNETTLSMSKTPLLIERKAALAAMRQEAQPDASSSSFTPAVLDARDTLLRLEHDEAWAAWVALQPAQREAEEAAAWRLRDRGNVYISGGKLSGADRFTPQGGVEPPTFVLGAPGARWYDVPQRAGTLQFLPSTIVRLVRNHTLPGAAYDAWKATFRVPLNMHKHGLRSYLLAIYGLRTTWVRSMIYRAPGLTNPHSTRRAGKARGYGRRTWKKVEVGLLEPFVFPEISPAFKREAADGGLLGEETEMERMRSLIALRRGGRWRAKRAPDPYSPTEAKSTTAHQGTFVSKPAAGADTQSKDKNEPVKRPVILTLKGGIPTAKHSRILELLGANKKLREQRIEAEVRMALGGGSKGGEKDN